MLPSRQRQMLRVRTRTPLCGLSMTLVETRDRAKLGDKPKRLTVTFPAWVVSRWIFCYQGTD